MKSVTIESKQVGQAFAIVAVVRDARSRKLHTTRELPYGMESLACDLAREWAVSRGYHVVNKGE